MPEKDAERIQQVEGELSRLREQHELLASAMATINGYERLAVVVEHGFTDLFEQLAPLREMRPIRTGTPLEDEVDDRVNIARRVGRVAMIVLIGIAPVAAGAVGYYLGRQDPQTSQPASYQGDRSPVRRR
jgi:hypothetical protein